MPAKPGQPAQDVLVALSKFDAVIAELRTAAHRPHARLLLHYEEGPAMRIMPLQLLMSTNRVLNLRAKAELELGKTDEAFADVEV